MDTQTLEATEIQEKTRIARFDPDPYRYGWHEVPRTLPDGSIDFDRIPLTMTDVLHPQEGFFRMQNSDHNRLCHYLLNVMGACVALDPTAVVLGDVRIDWGVPHPRPHGPDVAVIFGVQEHQTWGTFSVTQEGVRPALIIEVTSPETRMNDLVTKVTHYARVQVPQYIVVSQRRQRGTPVSTRILLGYRLAPGATAYTKQTPDEQGRFWLDAVGIWIGLEDNEVMCYDRQGRPIEDYAKLHVARQSAEERARNAEELARNAEERARKIEERLAHLEEELRRMKGGAAER